MVKTVKVGEWLVISNSAGHLGQSDRGDLVAVCESEDDAYFAARTCGLHRGVVTVGQAGKVRTPRGAELVDDES